MSSLDWKSCHRSRAGAESLWETFLQVSTGLPKRLHMDSDGVVRLRSSVRTFLCKTPDRMSVLEEDISSVKGLWCVTSDALAELQKGLSAVHLVPSKRTSVAGRKSIVMESIVGSDTVRDVPAPSELCVVLNPAGSESLTCCVRCEILRSEWERNEVLVLSRHSPRQFCLVLQTHVHKAFCEAALELDSNSNDPRFDWDFWKVSDCLVESSLGLWESSLERLRIDRSVMGEPQSGISSVASSSSTFISLSFISTGPGTRSGELTLHFTLKIVWVHYSASQDHIYYLHITYSVSRKPFSWKITELQCSQE